MKVVSIKSFTQPSIVCDILSKRLVSVHLCDKNEFLCFDLAIGLGFTYISPDLWQKVFVVLPYEAFASETRNSLKKLRDF
jgi:hypothetical protein